GLEKTIAPAQILGGLTHFQQLMLPVNATAGAAAIPAALGAAGPVGGGSTGSKGVTFGDFWGKIPPSSEECWLAQEDLWVKREVLDIVRGALNHAARFERSEIDLKKEPPGPGITAHHRFVNNTWQVDLLIEQQPGQRHKFISGRSTIKNIQP